MGCYGMAQQGVCPLGPRFGFRGARHFPCSTGRGNPGRCIGKASLGQDSNGCEAQEEELGEGPTRPAFMPAPAWSRHPDAGHGATELWVFDTPP